MKENNQPCWLKWVGYFTLCALVLIVGYSLYLSIDKQEEAAMAKDYQESLDNIDVTSGDGETITVATDSTETDGGIDPASLGDDYSSQEEIVLSEE